MISCLSVQEGWGYKPDFAVLSDNVDSELFMIEHRNLIGFFPEDYPINQENN